MAEELYSRILAGSPSVLLVDDDVNILDTAKDILEDKNYQVTTASNGKQALEKLGQQAFNVVVVDFQLPDATGLELARKVREHNDHTCVILMTGHASLEMAVKAIQEAVYDYLIKPVDPAQLQRTLEKAIEKQRLTLENQQLVDDLRKMNEQLARFDVLKSRMLTVLSHDLRTPLASIRGYSELLRSGVKGKLSDGQKKMTEITIQEADHLNGLIGDLLDLAHIEAGNLNIEKRPIRFEELLDKAVQRVKLVSEMKEVGVEVVQDGTLPMVEVDVTRMIQVLSNLLRGSLKRCTRGGRIFLNTTEKGSSIEVKITHTGQGFTPEQMKVLFVSQKSPTDPDGVPDGLRVGLAIGREIVHAHGGDIGVDSRGPEHGCTFWIRLPIMRGN